MHLRIIYTVPEHLNVVAEFCTFEHVAREYLSCVLPRPNYLRMDTRNGFLIDRLADDHSRCLVVEDTVLANECSSMMAAVSCSINRYTVSRESAKTSDIRFKRCSLSLR